MKSIPASETVWETITQKGGAVWYITSKQNREMYFLYKSTNGEVVKVGKDKDPSRLHEKYVGASGAANNESRKER